MTTLIIITSKLLLLYCYNTDRGTWLLNFEYLFLVLVRNIFATKSNLILSFVDNVDDGFSLVMFCVSMTTSISMMTITMIMTGKSTANSIEMAKMVILPTDQLYVDPASGAVQVIPTAISPTGPPPGWNAYRSGKPTQLRASNGGPSPSSQSKLSLNSPR